MGFEGGLGENGKKELKKTMKTITEAAVKNNPAVQEAIAVAVRNEILNNPRKFIDADNR